MRENDLLQNSIPAPASKALTIIVKGYHEFDAENTFEGDVVGAAVTFKF